MLFQILQFQIVAQQIQRQVAYNFARRRHLHDVAESHVHVRIHARYFGPASAQSYRLRLRF